MGLPSAKPIAATATRVCAKCRTTDANTDAAHWAAIERELLALGESVKTNPRAQPATATESPSEFLNKAREDLEQTRRTHEPD